MNLRPLYCFYLRYNLVINKTLYILFAGVMVSMSGYGGYFAATEYITADARVQKAVADRREYEDVLAGKIKMIEPVGGKYARMAKVKVEWELVEVVN